VLPRTTREYIRIASTLPNAVATRHGVEVTSRLWRCGILRSLPEHAPADFDRPAE
jgi:hypothetical protein